MFVFVWYVLLIVVTLIGFNILLDYRRYGKKIFDCFKKKNREVDMTDLLINILKNELHNKALVLKRNNDYFIAITKYDIFLIQLINEKIKISGSINDKLFKSKEKNIKDIVNPLPQFIKETKILLNNKMVIKPIIVKTNKECILNLKDFDKRNILTLQDFSYMLYKLQRTSLKYEENELNNKLLEIKGLLDGNN